MPVLPSAVKSDPRASNLRPGPDHQNDFDERRRPRSPAEAQASFAFLPPPAGPLRPACAIIALARARAAAAAGVNSGTARNFNLKIWRPLCGLGARPLRAGSAAPSRWPAPSGWQGVRGAAWGHWHCARGRGNDGETTDGPVYGWPGMSADPAGRAADDGAAVGVHKLRRTEHWTLGERCPRIGIRRRKLGGWHE